MIQAQHFYNSTSIIFAIIVFLNSIVCAAFVLKKVSEWCPISLAVVYVNTLYAITSGIPLLLLNEIIEYNYFNEYLKELTPLSWTVYYIQIFVLQVTLISIYLISRHAKRRTVIDRFGKKHTLSILIALFIFFLIYSRMGIFEFINDNGFFSYLASRTRSQMIAENSLLLTTIFGKIKDVLLPILGIMLIVRIDKAILKALAIVIIIFMLSLGLKKYPLMFFMASLLVMALRSEDINKRVKWVAVILIPIVVYPMYELVMISQGNTDQSILSPILRVILTPHTSALNKYYFVQNYGFAGSEFVSNPDFLINFTTIVYGVGFGDTGNFLSISWLENGWGEYYKQLSYFAIMIALYQYMYRRVRSKIVKEFSILIFIYSLFPLVSVDINTWSSHYLIKWCVVLMVVVEIRRRGVNLLSTRSKNESGGFDIEVHNSAKSGKTTSYL